MADPLSNLVHEYEAQQRWARGEMPSFSSNVVDMLTCGYGDLDDFGNWQFPLYPAERYLELTREREVLIQQAMKPRFFGLMSARSREEAIEHLEGFDWSEYSLIALTGGLDASRVEALLALCKVPDTSDVKLSSSDAEILDGDFE